MLILLALSLSSCGNTKPPCLPHPPVTAASPNACPEPTSQSLNRALVLALHNWLDIDNCPVGRYSVDQVVIRAGQPVQRLPLLMEGKINAVVHAGGGERPDVVPIWFGPGEIVMLSYIFSEQISNVDMVATEPTEVRWIHIREIEALMESKPGLAVMLVKFLSKRLREVQGRERGWVERGVPVRVASALLRMASDVPAESGELVLNATHEHIAHRAGVSRPKASMALKNLEREGHVRLGRGQVSVLNIAGLKAMLG